jgi:hypothetical protein
LDSLSEQFCEYNNQQDDQKDAHDCPNPHSGHHFKHGFFLQFRFKQLSDPKQRSVLASAPRGILSAIARGPAITPFEHEAEVAPLMSHGAMARHTA